MFDKPLLPFMDQGCLIHTIDVATGHDRCAFELNSAASYMTVGAVALVVGMSLYLWRRFKKSRAL